MTPAGATCTCPDGFSGARCETALLSTVCSEGWCLHGGDCRVSNAVAVCTCPEGYTGTRCETLPAICANNPCQNGGHCRVNRSAVSCECPLTHEGERCERARPTQPNLCPVGVTWTNMTNMGSNGLMMMRQAPSGHWYEAHRNGEVWVAPPSGARGESPLLTVPATIDGEMGLLGLALHPTFPTEPYLYVYYANMSGVNGNSVLFIERYRVDNAASAPSIDAETRTEIFRFDRGHASAYHLGGTIEFNPRASRAELYFASGDGATLDGGDCVSFSSNAEEDCSSQNPNSYHGKLLRFDVSDASASAYPPEVVALGLRNPFRWSFDSVTGDLWLADVGDSSFEELDYVLASDLPTAGEAPLNFGWPCLEGFSPHSGGLICTQLGETIRPLHAYGREVGVSIIGGRVYRGRAVVGAQGSYHFDDAFPQNGSAAWQLVSNQESDPTSLEDDYDRSNVDAGGFVAFTEDSAGELYAIDLEGSVYRLQALAGGTSSASCGAR
jgi:glucose/arabinose dehydrogenase